MSDSLDDGGSGGDGGGGAPRELDRFRKAYCIRFDGGTRVAWSASDSFSVAGFRKLTQKQVCAVAGPRRTHKLREDLNEHDHKPHLSLRALALAKTRAAIFRWPVDGLRLEQHQYALQHEISSLKAEYGRIANDYSFALSRYDEDRLDARERTQAMKDQAHMQRELTTVAVQLRQKQTTYRQVLGDSMRTLTLKGLRAAVGDRKMRAELEAALRATPLQRRFCDALFKVMWSNEALEEVEFTHMRVPEREAGLIAWLLNHWRTKVLVARHCTLTTAAVFGIVQMCRLQPQRQVLVRLDLGFNRIGLAGVRNVAKMLEKNTRLRALGLAGNRVDVMGAEALAASLRKNSTLQHLDLFMNDLDIGGACAIAEYLRDSASLLSLNVRSNHIYPEGAAVIAEALRHNSTLQDLQIADNYIGPEGAAVIGASFKGSVNAIRAALGDPVAVAAAKPDGSVAASTAPLLGQHPGGGGGGSSGGGSGGGGGGSGSGGGGGDGGGGGSSGGSPAPQAP